MKEFVTICRLFTKTISIIPHRYRVFDSIEKRSENERGERKGRGYSGWILLARGVPAMTYSQIRTSVHNLSVVPPSAPAPYPPSPFPGCSVPLVERPYFFAPRNYSSQITGLYRGKLIMLQRLYEMEYCVARRRNKKVASNTTVECSVIISNAGARRIGRQEKNVEDSLRCCRSLVLALVRARVDLHRDFCVGWSRASISIKKQMEETRWFLLRKLRYLYRQKLLHI